MNEPLGEYGGEVTRKVTLFQREYAVGERLSPELLKDVSLRHRVALKGAGLVKYYSEPEGAAAAVDASPMDVAVTKKKKAKKTSAKKKTKKKTPSKSTAKRRK